MMKTPSFAIQLPVGSLSRCDGILDMVTGFVDQLKALHQVEQTIPAVLEAILQATHADFCYVFSNRSKLVKGIAGHAVPTEPSCIRFANQLLAMRSVDSDELIWQCDAQRIRQRASRTPWSAIMIRVGSTQSWIVIASMNPRRIFGFDDLKIMRLFEQIVLNHHSQIDNRIKELLTGMVMCLSNTVEAKDPYTAGHSERVARVGVLLGKKLGATPAQLSDIYLAGLIHDIGKIGIRDSILLKRGPLTGDERVQMKEHPVIGDRIVASIPQFHRLRSGVRHHHERFDGRGYPDGLRGSQIPWLARVLAIADAFDAMMSPRRYRPALTPAAILQVFREETGKQFDPELTDHFITCLPHILPPIYHQGVGDSAYYGVTDLLSPLDNASAISPVPPKPAAIRHPCPIVPKPR